MRPSSRASPLPHSIAFRQKRLGQMWEQARSHIQSRSVRRNPVKCGSKPAPTFNRVLSEETRSNVGASPLPHSIAFCQKKPGQMWEQARSHIQSRSVRRNSVKCGSKPAPTFNRVPSEETRSNVGAGLLAKRPVCSSPLWVMRTQFGGRQRPLQRRPADLHRHLQPVRRPPRCLLNLQALILLILRS